jgi:hypothetical protein
VAPQETATKRKEGVDEINQTLHNLAPLLLVNKTIRKRSKASSTEYSVL